MMLPVTLNGMGSWLSSMLQIHKFLSLNGAENLECVEPYGSSRSKENSSNNENAQSVTMKMIKVKNEWKNPYIYNKILSYPR